MNDPRAAAQKSDPDGSRSLRGWLSRTLQGLRPAASSSKSASTSTVGMRFARVLHDAKWVLDVEFFDAMPPEFIWPTDPPVSRAPGTEDRFQSLFDNLQDYSAIVLSGQEREHILEPAPPAEARTHWTNYVLRSGAVSHWSYQIRPTHGSPDMPVLRCGNGAKLYYDPCRSRIWRLGLPLSSACSSRFHIPIDGIAAEVHRLEKMGIDPYADTREDAVLHLPPRIHRGRFAVEFSETLVVVHSPAGRRLTLGLRPAFRYGSIPPIRGAFSPLSLSFLGEEAVLVRRDEASERAAIVAMENQGLRFATVLGPDDPEDVAVDLQSLYGVYACPSDSLGLAPIRDGIRAELDRLGISCTFESVHESSQWEELYVDAVHYRFQWREDGFGLRLNCRAIVGDESFDILTELVEQWQGEIAPGDEDANPSLVVLGFQRLWIDPKLIDLGLRALVAAFDGDPNRSSNELLGSVFRQVDDLAAMDQFQRALDLQRLVLEKLPPMEDVPAPPGLGTTLKDHQVTGLSRLAWMRRINVGAVIGDAPGLGKTIQVIALILHLRQAGLLNKPVLIVCPTVAVQHWMREISAWAPDLQYFHQPEAGGRQIELRSQIILTTYGRLKNNKAHSQAPRFREVSWGLLVLDEVHEHLNGMASNCIQNLPTDFSIGLTGTPNRKSNLEIHSLLRMITPRDFLGSGLSFSRLFVSEAGESLQPLAHQILQERNDFFVLRRTRCDAGQELPPLLIEDRVVPMDSLTWKHYEKTRAIAYSGLEMTARVETLKESMLAVHNAMVRLRKVSFDPFAHLGYEEARMYLSPKQRVVLSIVKERASNGRKTLVFTDRTDSVVEMVRVFGNHQVRCQYIHGKVSNRQTRVDRFQSEDIPVMVLTPRTGGIALTITSADLVIVMDPWLDLEREFQSISRSFRIGQTQTVQVLRLLSEGSLESKINELLKAHRTRRVDAEDIVIDEAGLLSSMTQEQMFALFDPVPAPEPAEPSCLVNNVDRLAEFDEGLELYR